MTHRDSSVKVRSAATFTTGWASQGIPDTARADGHCPGRARPRIHLAKNTSGVVAVNNLLILKAESTSAAEARPASSQDGTAVIDTGIFRVVSHQVAQ